MLILLQFSGMAQHFQSVTSSGLPAQLELLSTLADRREGGMYPIASTNLPLQDGTIRRIVLFCSIPNGNHIVNNMVIVHCLFDIVGHIASLPFYYVFR